MSKLIGTDPNQVPSNADLGTAAYMDTKEFLLARGGELSAIDSIINDTATDVFVYDTGFDSDGGAWRHRTQHTSWYNEKLNTEDRGSKRRFPSVVVIVATISSVTLYDADDPTLPMWMRFRAGTTGMADRMILQGNSSDPFSVHMLNGVLVIGWGNESSSYGSPIINFINEKTVRADSQADTTEGGKFLGNISQRNTTHLGYESTSTEDYDIFTTKINDVTMTVLPNAPIDSSTGLPVPTIALATDGGLNIIKDNGTVIGINPDTGGQYDPVTRVEFIGTTEIAYASLNTAVWYLSPIPSSDTTYSAYNDKTGNVDRVIYGGFYSSPEIVLTDDNDFAYSTRDIVTQNREEINFQTRQGLNKVYRDIADESKGSNAVIKHDYNTGWMPGDIKLATLSDTDTTVAVGTELVTNGTFDSDTDWDKGTGWSISGGTASCDGSQSANTTLNTTAGLGWVTGETYVITLDITAISGTINIASEGFTSSQFTTTGTISITRTKSATDDKLYINALGASTTVTIDNVSVRLAELDRSYNSYDLQVYGTIKKNPVATGADLVGYSGFNASSYLYLPFNSDLAFGNGEYFASIWFKDGATNEMLINVASNGTNQIWGIRIHTNDKLLAQVTDDGFVSRSIINTGPDVVGHDWQMASITRLSNGVINLYLNGELLGSGSAVEANLTDPARVLFGVENGSGNKPFSGSLALARISGKVPSDEHIKKIYEDEKFLFQDYAQATLYGTSDAITGLAYDNTTELLHAGTSDGRSVFQGLRRVDNTTDAVGTAISASNGLVAED